MVDAGKMLIVIPARGGSKRLPRKNVLQLAGKPLICWTIEAAIEANLNARIVVTSDDEEILTIARRYESDGVSAYKRSDKLATDTASTADVLVDLVQKEKSAGYLPKTIVLLQPTSPLRNADDIKDAIRVFRESGCKNTVVTVCVVDHPTAWICTIDDDQGLVGLDLSVKRSQDYQREYRLNGAVYVASAEYLMVTGSHLTERLYASVMPRKRSLDIDEKIDFHFCETLISAR